MPQHITKDTDIGQVLSAWHANEYEQYARGKWWYIIMIPLGVFFVLYGIITGNFLFSLLIILFAIVLFLQAYQPPPVVELKITDMGVIVGTRFYPYGELSDFFMIYQPPDVEMLYIQTQNKTSPLLRLPLYDCDPTEVKVSLRSFLPENVDIDEEPLSDRFTRNWMFH